MCTFGYITDATYEDVYTTGGRFILNTYLFHSLHSLSLLSNLSLFIETTPVIFPINVLKGIQAGLCDAAALAQMDWDFTRSFPLLLTSKRRSPTYPLSHIPFVYIPSHLY